VGDDPINLGVIHAECFEEAQEVMSQAQARFNCQESFINDLCLGLAVQFGPGTLGVISYCV
jgi:hypothetical protein